jgi:hypothetical protein
LITVWAFVTDQEVYLGSAVVIVTSEYGALRRWEETKVILALLPEDGSERVGTGLEVTASIVAVYISQRLVYVSEERDKDGERGSMHGSCECEGLVPFVLLD